MKLGIWSALVGVVVGIEMKWDQLEVLPSARGTYNQEEKFWTRGLTECDDQCQQQEGFVCGIDERQCCLGNCKNHFGFEVCDTLLDTFNCKVQD
jgi:hypothetical protein